MSLIKLQGNASGTGAFTIAAPNGNTDRTLTLPDATGTVVTADGSGNIATTSITPSAGIYLGGSGSANLLDDYEEGTWTPDLNFGGANTGITYSVRDGKYTKVGDICFISFRIVLTNKGSASGISKIGGMPFGGTSKNGGAVFYLGNMTGLTGTVNIGNTGGGGTQIELFDPAASGTINLDNGNFNNNSVVEASLTYHVA